MKVPLRIERSLLVSVPLAQTLGLLDDLETTIRRFPKLKRLHKRGEQCYVWEMETIGSRMARIAHNVRYGAAYTVDRPAGRLHWQPMAGEGNARIAGSLCLDPVDRAQTRLRFVVEGELYEVPVPLMYRLVAPPFIQGKFTSLVDRFLEQTAQALSR
jgi:carbon monoxide dehydrogenase subunit G